MGTFGCLKRANLSMFDEKQILLIDWGEISPHCKIFPFDDEFKLKETIICEAPNV